MDSKLEFSAQAFCKMVMHTMKHPQSVCSGLLLSPRLSSYDQDNQDEAKSSPETLQIIDAIPVLHNSHYLTPTMEIALNAVNNYAKEQELIISGYYQVDRFNSPACSDVFGQRVTEKITDSYSNAVLCLVSYEIGSTEGGSPSICLDQYQIVGGKWRRKPSQSFNVENDIDIIKERIICSKEKLYRDIIDFDDHLDNINLDWTNARISQSIDHLIANIC